MDENITCQGDGNRQERIPSDDHPDEIARWHAPSGPDTGPVRRR